MEPRANGANGANGAVVDITDTKWSHVHPNSTVVKKCPKGAKMEPKWSQLTREPIIEWSDIIGAN